MPMLVRGISPDPRTVSSCQRDARACGGDCLLQRARGLPVGRRTPPHHRRCIRGAAERGAGVSPGGAIDPRRVLLHVSRHQLALLWPMGLWHRRSAGAADAGHPPIVGSLVLYRLGPRPAKGQRLPARSAAVMGGRRSLVSPRGPCAPGRPAGRWLPLPGRDAPLHPGQRIDASRPADPPQLSRQSHRGHPARGLRAAPAGQDSRRGVTESLRPGAGAHRMDGTAARRPV